MHAFRELVRRRRTEGDPFRERMPADIRKTLDESGDAKEIFRRNCLLFRALTIENRGWV